MIKHLPECPSESIVCEGECCYCDRPHVCCCDALRSCEKRVIAAAVQRVEAQEAFTAVRKAVAALPEYALIGTSLMVILILVWAWTR